MPEFTLSGETILLIIAGIVVIAEVISAIAKGVKSWGELSGRNQRTAEMATMNTRITNLETDVAECQRRLNEGDGNFKAVRRDLAQVMDVLDGLLLHFISGNDKETLKGVKADLDHYKSRRGMEEDEE